MEDGTDGDNTDGPSSTVPDSRVTAATLARSQRLSLLATATGAGARRLISKGLASSESAERRAEEIMEENRKKELAARMEEGTVEGEDDEAVATLLEQAEELRRKKELLNEEELATATLLSNEERLLKEANTVSTNALTSAKDEASGTVYSESMKSSWTAPRAILALPESANQAVRDKWHILVEGVDIPPPIRTFREMKLPPPLLAALKAKNINRPTPIQMQGLPVALSGRDMVGIAFTGSGKTVSFSLPLCLLALSEETKLPLVGGEGPIGVVLAPSRELARQTYDALEAYAEAIGRDPKYPQVREKDRR